MIDYLDKYKGQYGRNSVYDILSLNPDIPSDWEIIRRDYVAVDIEKVKIDSDTFTNYGDFQFVWEKSFVKSPERSGAGVISNLNAHSTFVTPHLIINFSIMSIDDYRAIMRKDLERNEFVVECYDPIYNVPVTKKMYFATPEMAKLFTIAKVRNNAEHWEEFIELVGVREYTVELIGTNADLDLVSVIYHLNPPSDTGYTDRTIGEDDVYSGEEIVIGGVATEFSSETFGGKYKFTKWNISAENPTIPKEQGNYLDGYAYTINNDLVLYAQWESANEHKLLFNYGVADPAINESDYTYETSRSVIMGKSIGVLPVARTPIVNTKDLNGNLQDYEPYFNGKWYKTPIKANNSVAISDNDLYWSKRDSTIYLIYDVRNYNLTLYLDGSRFSQTTIKYGTEIILPQPVRDGYRFDGWYTSSNFQGTKMSNGTMPPYGLTLYARWIAND